MKFTAWRQKLAKSIATQSDVYDVNGNSDIIIYRPRSGYFLGMWLQTKDRKIKIYGDDNGHISIVHRDFVGDHVEGPVHQHAYIELGYVDKGCASQVFSKQEYRFHEGDFWIIDKNCYHSDVYCSDDLFEVYIGIPSEVFDVVFLESVGDSPVQQFIYNALVKQKEKRQFLKFSPREDKITARRLMEGIVNELDGKRAGTKDIVKGMLVRLMALLASEYDTLLANQDKVKIHELSYKEVEANIHANYQTVKINKLIDRFHYNSDFYNRIIKENSGLTYSEYLQNIRLDQAASMLLNSELAVSEVIAHIGYQSKGYFYKIFEDRYHMTPVEYRNTKKLRHL